MPSLTVGFGDLLPEARVEQKNESGVKVGFTDPPGAASKTTPLGGPREFGAAEDRNKTGPKSSDADRGGVASWLESPDFKVEVEPAASEWEELRGERVRKMSSVGGAAREAGEAGVSAARERRATAAREGIQKERAQRRARVKSESAVDEFPSARSILGPPGLRQIDDGPARETEPVRKAGPSAARTPRGWVITRRLGVGVAVAILLSLGCLMLPLTVIWSLDGEAAGALAGQLRNGNDAELRIAGVARLPRTEWWATRAETLISRAVLLQRVGEKGESGSEAEFLLSAARSASSVESERRAAGAAAMNAGMEGKGLDAESFGLSRDIYPLLASARRLLAAERRDEALELYRQSFDLLLRDPTIDHMRADYIEGKDDRFALPRETLALVIARELVNQSWLGYDLWSTIVPADGVFHLAVYRALREESRGEASRARTALLGIEARGEAGRRAATLAAQGEGMIASDQWSAAVEVYQRAIEMQPDEQVRRAWWFNLARIYGHLGDRESAHGAWIKARDNHPNDLIGRRVTRGLSQMSAAMRAGVPESPRIMGGTAR
jgi:tetratricopeptide (TPR) repeat protein